MLGAEQARSAAKKILAEVALGGDPAAARDDRRGRDRLSLQSVVDDFLSAKAATMRPRSLSTLKLYLTGAYFRPFHGTPIDNVSRRDIAARLVTIERDSGASTAAKARAALSSMFVWAMRSGLTDSNPAAGTPKPAAGRPRERVLSDAELAAVWRAAGEDDFGRITRPFDLPGAVEQRSAGCAGRRSTPSARSGPCRRRDRRISGRIRCRSWR